MGLIAATTLPYAPAGHAGHDPDEAKLQEPAAHAVHTAELVAPKTGENVPATHRTQVSVDQPGA